MKKTAFVSCLIALSFLFCTRENETGRLVVRMSDSPGNCEAVHLDIREVQIRRRSDGEPRWISLPNINKGIYNLPHFNDQAKTQLPGSSDMNNIRLVLGDSNSVVIGGVSYPLKTPGMHESGLKLQADLTKGITYAVLLDLAAVSVRETDGEEYVLKPVLKVISETVDGAVTGQVIPAELNVAVYAISGSDTISTGHAPPGISEFFVGSLPGGKYTIVFDAERSSGYDVIKLEDVSVTNNAAVAYASVD